MYDQVKKGLAPLYIGIVIAIAGCQATQVVEKTPVTQPVVDTTAQQAKYVESLNSAPVNNAWLATFNDAKVESLVQEAMENNPNLQASYYSVVSATTQIRVSQSTLLPTVGWAASTSESISSADVPNLVDNLNSGSNAGFGINWEADLWGRLSAGVSATEASVRSAVADYSFARQSLAAAVTTGWFQYISATQQLALSKNILQNYEATLELVKKRYAVGQVTKKDVVQTEVQITNARDAIAQAELGVSIVARGLESLLGRYPSATIESSSELPELPAFPNTGVPIDMLERRPDVIAAEERLRAAFFVSGSAKLARYPSLNLSYNPATTNSFDFISSLTASIAGPLYTGGAIEAQIDAADANQKAALMSYQSTVLKSFKETEQLIANEKNYLQRINLLKSIVDDNEEALRLTKVQYEVGKIDSSVLLAQQSAYEAARVTYLGIQNAILANRIQLYLALGGSFDEEGSLLDVDAFELPEKPAKT